MKLVDKLFEKGSGGSLTLVPEEQEDMWHIYNLVSSGDVVKSVTFRKVTTESATGSTSSNRIRTVLSLCVEDIHFDAVGSRLHLKGRNVAENAHVKMGAYHTLDLELQRKFTLTKTEWDSVALERIDMAVDPSKKADLGAIVMQEGLANVCLITNSMTIVRAKIDMNIPKKRRGSVQQHEKGLLRFYESVLQALLRHFNFDVLKCVLIASPGFTKDQFFDLNSFSFILLRVSKHSLKEVLQDPMIQTRLSDTKASQEVRALEHFYKTLQNDSARAFYGVKHVMLANEAHAIECLLISDKLFRSIDVQTRRKYVSLHVSGEQLDQLTGLCALLRFPMAELEDEDTSDEETSDENDGDKDEEHQVNDN
ncbi:PELO [Lepeophtheirus salmonis]|uniref:Protein pelota homolog n=1 Tax=Lepeophtheirus salmonis TaxID=72036 RepID=A0A7R8D8L1_LEPSM|nr:PELO [Lepeophtheirus salmonis]CAF3037432.1 PELO [Lepeophtheirus salmonis]